VSVRPTFSSRHESDPRVVAERSGGVVIAWINEHRDGPLAKPTKSC
jgi:hypothetical protein